MCMCVCGVCVFRVRALKDAKEDDNTSNEFVHDTQRLGSILCERSMHNEEGV
jgi:hypothetical protein